MESSSRHARMDTEQTPFEPIDMVLRALILFDRSDKSAARTAPTKWTHESGWTHPLIWILKNREKRFLSCYEIEHPTPNYRKECQNLSKKNLFTIARHSSAKKARKGALLNPRQIKNREGKAQFLHTRHGFVHVFSPYLVPFRGFVSTPKNKKSTPNFFLALTF